MARKKWLHYPQRIEGTKEEEGIHKNYCGQEIMNAVFYWHITYLQGETPLDNIKNSNNLKKPMYFELLKLYIYHIHKQCT